MNLPINELVSIGNLWILHLESKNILKKEWEVKIQKNESSSKITYVHKSIVSDVKIEGILEEHMLALVHALYLKHKTRG
tara:strand:- start:4408 stop:4644 length:237 start_codon:yes stop_codon:yes gene_type:complete